MTHSDARRHLKNIVKKYFENAEVDFAHRSHKPKANAPYVCITTGAPVRDLYPGERLVDGEMVRYYHTSLPVQIDLFTHGADGEPDSSGYVSGEDTAVDDLTDFLDYLESPFVTEWCDRLDISIDTNGGVQSLTGLITDTDYEFRAMAELVFRYVHKAVGHAGAAGEDSIRHPGGEAQGDGSKPGYVTPEDTDPGVTVEPEFKPTPSGGRGEELVNSETGYFTAVEITHTKEENK